MKENKNAIHYEEFSISELKNIAAEIIREVERRVETQQQEAMQEIRQAMLAYCQEFGPITFCIDDIETVVDAKYVVFDLDTITVE